MSTSNRKPRGNTANAAQQADQARCAGPLQLTLDLRFLDPPETRSPKIGQVDLPGPRDFDTAANEMARHSNAAESGDENVEQCELQVNGADADLPVSPAHPDLRLGSADSEVPVAADLSIFSTHWVLSSERPTSRPFSRFRREIARLIDGFRASAHLPPAGQNGERDADSD